MQRLVVVACLLTLALLAFVAAGAGVGGWAPKICFSLFSLRCTALKPHAPSGVCGARSYGLGGVLSHLAGFRPPAGTAFSLFFCGLPCLGPQSGAHQLVRLLLFGSATFLCLSLQVIRRPAAPAVLCRPRASTGLELVPFLQSNAPVGVQFHESFIQSLRAFRRAQHHQKQAWGSNLIQKCDF